VGTAEVEVSSFGVVLAEDEAGAVAEDVVVAEDAVVVDDAMVVESAVVVANSGSVVAAEVTDGDEVTPEPSPALPVVGLLQLHAGAS
jgi:hypothetical protein